MKYRLSDGHVLTAAELGRLDEIEARLRHDPANAEIAESAWARAQRGKHATVAREARVVGPARMPRPATRPGQKRLPRRDRRQVGAQNSDAAGVFDQPLQNTCALPGQTGEFARTTRDLPFRRAKATDSNAPSVKASDPGSGSGDAAKSSIVT